MERACRSGNNGSGGRERVGVGWGKQGRERVSDLEVGSRGGGWVDDTEPARSAAPSTRMLVFRIGLPQAAFRVGRRQAPFRMCFDA